MFPNIFMIDATELQGKSIYIFHVVLDKIRDGLAVLV